ncbi:MAG: hypothetical protein QM811_28655 [Pirellulales bacterium]
MPGDFLDLSSDPRPADDAKSAAHGDMRKFVGIHFVCCDVYSRVYINAARTAYAGHCPRCMKKIEVKIGPGGSDSRFFTAG